MSLLKKLLGREELQPYKNKIVATAPIAYWPLNEISGTTAINYGTLGVAANGTYSGATLAQIQAPGGELAPSFDGTNDFVNIYSAALAGAFNGALGSVSCWCKVSAAAVWTDATVRVIYYLFADSNNQIFANRLTTNNQFQMIYEAANVTEQRTNTTTTTDWFHIVTTWSKTAEQVKYYFNGALMETDITLGIWAGVLGANTTVLGSSSSAVPAACWKGYLAHPAIYDKVLDLPTILSLYNSGL